MRKLLLASAALAALSFGTAHAAPKSLALGVDLQLNAAPQVATTNIGGTPVTVGADLGVTTQAIGNSLSVTNDKSRGLAVGLEAQGNIAAQAATTNLGGITVSHDVTVTTAAVGNAVDVTAADHKGIALNGGLQINAAPQFAETNVVGGSFQHVSNFTTQAVGNDISVSGAAAVDVALQGNFGAGQLAETNITGTSSTHTEGGITIPGLGTFGGHDVTTLTPVSFGSDVTVDTNAIGSIASATGDRLAGQLSIQGNFAPQVALTNISNAHFSGALNVSTVAAGNVANVTVK